MESKKNNKKKKNKADQPPKWPILYDFVKITGALPTLLLMRARTIYINGKKKNPLKGGVLITANHTGFLDPPQIFVSFWKRRIYSLATKDLYKNKFWRTFFKAMCCIETDKENFSMQSFHKAVNFLKADKAVLIFPEGGVNTTEDTVKAYKSGAVLIAHRANKPILPVYIVKVDKWYNRRTLVVGEPIDVKALCGPIPTASAIDNVSEIIRQKELELVEFYQNNYLNKSKGKENEQK